MAGWRPSGVSANKVFHLGYNGHPKYLFQTVQNFLYYHITINTWGHNVLYFFSVSKQELRNSLYLGCLSVESAYIEMEYMNNVLM